MNHDKRINDLLAQARGLVAKEQARIEATVEAQMAGLVGDLGKAGTAVIAAPRGGSFDLGSRARKRKGVAAARRTPNADEEVLGGEEGQKATGSKARKALPAPTAETAKG
jgi:hypothetical protein